MAKAIMQLNNIYRSFKKGRTIIPVLKDINIDLEEQEYICFVGESGCGKTTLGKIITGLLKPSSGELIYQGRNVASLKGADFTDYRRGVQIIHQDPYASLNPTHTIFDILSFPLYRHKVVKGRKAAREKVSDLLTSVGLTPVAAVIDKYPHQLSGGQRQRVGIARALTTNPKVIVADESVSMVDVSIRISILHMMMKMREELGSTMIFITHDLALAKYFAWKGRIAVMYLGRIVEIGTTPEITQNPQHPYTKSLLSALPEPDPDVTRRKEKIQLRSEDIPRLTELPPGCPFHPRCPWFVEGVCDGEIPVLADVPGSDSNAKVACTPLTAGDGLKLYGSTAS